jgi:hypothetical protein
MGFETVEAAGIVAGEICAWSVQASPRSDVDKKRKRKKAKQHGINWINAAQFNGGMCAMWEAGSLLEQRQHLLGAMGRSVSDQAEVVLGFRAAGLGISPVCIMEL